MPDSTNTHGPQSRVRQQDATLSHVLRDDVMDRVYALRDVLQAYELLEMLLDPVRRHEAALMDVGRGQIGAMLRVLNSEFLSRLPAVKAVIQPPSAKTAPPAP